ncbi:MAG: YdcF family protein [Pseudomonadota bacterium]
MSNYHLWWLVQPSHLIVWGLLLSAALRLRARWHRRANVLGVCSLMALALGAFSPLSTWLMAPLEERFERFNARVDTPCGFIVLAGAEQVSLTNLHGTPHLNGFADRLTSLVVLAAQHPDATLVHSGRGSTRRGHTQSTVARWFFRAALPEREVVYENRSRNTYEAAVEVARMFETGSLVREPIAGCRWGIVTSAFHIPRAMGAFRAQDLNDVLAVPTDYTTGPTNFALPQAAAHLTQLDWAAHEWVGLLWYRVHGYTHEWFPAPGPAS